MPRECSRYPPPALPRIRRSRSWRSRNWNGWATFRSDRLLHQWNEALAQLAAIVAGGDFHEARSGGGGFHGGVGGGRYPLGGQQGGLFAAAEEPQVAPHNPIAKAEPTVERELAPQRGNDPYPAAKSFGAALIAIAEKGDLAPQFEVRLAIQQVEAG